jgi:plasmid stability protein
MSDTIPATIHLPKTLHRALKVKAAETEGSSISSIARQALEVALREDFEDLNAFKARKSDKTESYESFLAGLKADGKI